MHSVISAKLDYCNSLFVDIPDFLITKLQRVQNAATRIVLIEFEEVRLCNTLSDETALATCKTAIIYKLNLIVFKALKGDALNYIQSLLSINQLARLLCSGDQIYKLKEPRWKLKSKGYQSLHIAVPCYWNSLLDDVRNIELDLNYFSKRKSAFVGVAQ